MRCKSSTMLQQRDLVPRGAWFAVKLENLLDSHQMAHLSGFPLLFAHLWVK